MSLWHDRMHTAIEKARQAGLKYHATHDLPNWYRCMFGDIGLVILSRFPIIKSKFHDFKYPAVLEDAMANKGVLYTKIDLSSKGGSALHLFNLHT